MVMIPSKYSFLKSIEMAKKTPRFTFVTHRCISTEHLKSNSQWNIWHWRRERPRSQSRWLIWKQIVKCARLTLILLTPRQRYCSEKKEVADGGWEVWVKGAGEGAGKC